MGRRSGVMPLKATLLLLALVGFTGRVGGSPKRKYFIVETDDKEPNIQEHDQDIADPDKEPSIQEHGQDLADHDTDGNIDIKRTFKTNERNTKRGKDFSSVALDESWTKEKKECIGDMMDERQYQIDNGVKDSSAVCDKMTIKCLKLLGIIKNCKRN